MPAPAGFDLTKLLALRLGAEFRAVRAQIPKAAFRGSYGTWPETPGAGAVVYEQGDVVWHKKKLWLCGFRQQSGGTILPPGTAATPLFSNPNANADISGVTGGAARTTSPPAGGPASTGYIINANANTLTIIVSPTVGPLVRFGFWYYQADNNALAALAAGSMVGGNLPFQNPALLVNLERTGVWTWHQVVVPTTGYDHSGIQISGNFGTTPMYVAGIVVDQPPWIEVPLESSSVAKLADLTDVDVKTTAPTGGQALVFDQASGLWKPGTVAASGGTPTNFVYQNSDGSYPDRPSVSTPVVFYGAGDPTAKMLDGDSWVDTTDGSASPGGYLTWNYGTSKYPGRADSQPVTWVGPVSPLDLGLMVNGDIWVNTTTAAYSPTVYVTSTDVDNYIANRVNDSTTPSQAYNAVKALADARAAAALAGVGISRELHYPANMPSTMTSIDEFEAAAADNAWTRVDGTASVLTWKQQAGVMTASHAGGDAAAVIHALVKPLATTPATGDAFLTRVALHGTTTNYMMAGVVLSDGTTYGSGNQVLDLFYVGAAANHDARAFTGFNANPTTSSVRALVYGGQPIWLRLVMTAAGTWRADTSWDGITWVLGAGTVAKTITPTQVGIFVSTWGGAAPFSATFDFVRKMTGVS